MSFSPEVLSILSEVLGDTSLGKGVSFFRLKLKPDCLVGLTKPSLSPISSLACLVIILSSIGKNSDSSPHQQQHQLSAKPLRTPFISNKTVNMADDEIQALVVDNGSGMCKAGTSAYLLHKIIDLSKCVAMM